MFEEQLTIQDVLLNSEVNPIWQRLKSGWVMSPNNPIIAPVGNGVYYPAYLHIPAGYEYGGQTYYFIVWVTNKSTYATEMYVAKTFFEVWTGPIATSGLSWYHPAVVYVAGDAKPFKMTQWVSESSEPKNKWCESVDGLAWTSQDMTTFSIPTGWQTTPYGFMHLNYNSTATNSGDNPRNYTFWGFHSCNAEDRAGKTVAEQALIMWSADGVTWMSTIRTVGVPLIYGVEGKYGSRMSSCQLESGEWVGFTNLQGIETGLPWGLSLLYSENGMFFERPSGSVPHEQFGNAAIGGGQYALHEIECPCIKRIDNTLYLMWMGQTGASSSTRSIFTATHVLD